MSTIGLQLPMLQARLLGSVNCRGLMMASMLPAESFDSYVEKAQPLLSAHPHDVRRSLRAWLFGDPPGLHKVVSIYDLDLETITALDPRAKLILAEQMFGYMSGYEERCARQVHAMLVSGQLSADLQGRRHLYRMNSQAIDMVHQYIGAFEENLLSSDRDVMQHYRSSYSQTRISGGAARAVMEGYAAGVEITGDFIADQVRSERAPSVVLDGKGWRMNSARGELSSGVVGGLKYSAKQISWVGRQLELIMPLSGIEQSGAREYWSLWGAVAWPPRPDDPQLKAFERILGWKFHISSPEKDQVKISIDFRDTYYEE